MSAREPGSSTPRIAPNTLAAVLLGLIVLAGLGGVWWYVRPRASADTVEALGAVAADSLAGTGAVCRRDVLRGEPLPGDGTAALALWLTPGGRFAACLRAEPSRASSLHEALEWSDEDFDALPEETDAPPSEPAATTPPTSPQWEMRGIGRAMSRDRSEAEASVLAACQGFEVAIGEALQHESVCTPYPVGVVPDARLLSHAVRVLVVIARERLRAGQSRLAFEVLFDAVRLGQDLGRGRAAESRSIGVALTELALAQIEGLLASQLPWHEGDLEALERQAAVLARTPGLAGHYDTWAMDLLSDASIDPLQARGWSPPSPREAPRPWQDEPADAFVAGAAYLAEAARGLCAADSEPAACLTAWRGARDRAVLEARGVDEFVVERWPRLDRGGALRVSAREWFQRRVEELAQWLAVQRATDALALALRHRRLCEAQGQVSVRDLEAARAAEQTLVATRDLAVLPSALPYRPIEVGAPAWLDPAEGAGGEVRLPVWELYCPPLPQLGTTLFEFEARPSH